MNILLYYLCKSDSFWCEQKINESLYCIFPYSNDQCLNNLIQLSIMIRRISSNFHFWPLSIIKMFPSLFYLMIPPAPYILNKMTFNKCETRPLKMDLFLFGGYNWGVENICTVFQKLLHQTPNSNFLSNVV